MRQKTNIKMKDINHILSVITLNGLKTPIKNHKLDEWVQNKIHIYAGCKRHTSDLGTHTD